MSDNLRITTPMPATETAAKMAQNKNATGVQNIDPSKVLSKNNNQETEGQGMNYALNTDSVLSKFVEYLQHTPELGETLKKFLFANLASLRNLSKTTELNPDLESLMQAMKMSKEELAENLQFQLTNNNKFSGELFNILASLVNENNSKKLNDQVSFFLKYFDAFVSGRKTMDSIVYQLKDILQSIPQSQREAIVGEVKNLQVLNSEQALTSNLAILKDKVIPMIGKYVGNFNDMGEIRDKIGILLNDISKLNIASGEGMVKKFDELLNFLRYEHIDATIINRLTSSFNDKVGEMQKDQNTFIDCLIKVLSNNELRASSSTTKEMIDQTVSRLLIDNSVYMPYAHAFLPVIYDNKYIFSEIWAEKKGTSLGNENSKKLIIKFEIENAGVFQAIILLQDKNIRTELHVPETFKKDTGSIKKDISKIFAGHGFGVDSMEVESSSIDIKKEILQKAVEGRRTINVSI